MTLIGIAQSSASRFYLLPFRVIVANTFTLTNFLVNLLPTYSLFPTIRVFFPSFVSLFDFIRISSLSADRWKFTTIGRVFLHG
jgi:hypothetical protein